MVIFDAQEKEVLGEYKEYIGETTNNQAEYQAVVLALQKAKQFKPEELLINVDSELICNQLNGNFKIKNAEFQESFIKIWNLKQNFKKVEFKHVRRELNKLADKLVNQAIDEHLK